ncbi:MAG: UDP-2,4-diacetamido-2,4,6-trideoxy-beta-L-altropyranose hydrolase [Chloroflexi bacterium]|nr:UDP-2,4-diacetamido-2,4,6-trideoxy-beta-L-altropyranose hydrolase [Chloroflexota bacterium]
MRPILIRADAGPRIGSGHVSRMTALGQLLRDHGRQVHLATQTDPATLPSFVRELEIHELPRAMVTGSIDDARGLTAIAERIGAAWIVLDGTAFATDYQAAARAAGAKVMSVADGPVHHFVGDVLLDQNHRAELTRYSTASHTVRCLGTRYLMLRREFRRATPRVDRAGAPRRVLVSLGGGATAARDALARLAPVLDAIGLRSVRFRVIAGPLTEVPEAIRALGREQPGRFDLARSVDDMAAEMDAADAAISAGGSTVWELMWMRVPFLGISLTEAQAAFLAAIDRDGLCAYLGPGDRIGRADASRIEAFLGDGARLAALAQAAGAVVDPRRSGEALLDVFADA